MYSHFSKIDNCYFIIICDPVHSNAQTFWCFDNFSKSDSKLSEYFLPQINFEIPQWAPGECQTICLSPYKREMLS